MSAHSSLKIEEVNYDKKRPEASNPLKIMDLSLRDGHQSLFSTRGRTEDMIPIAELMDEAGFWAVETWGGASFDAMHRFLNEDPWERLKTLKKYFKKTPMSMLLRGQNLVGYKNYSDELVKIFIDKAAESGMYIFRTFDALNDFRNFESSLKAVKEAGCHFQGCISYSLTEARLGGELYNINYYISKAKELEAMGSDSLCIKDMAGLLAPYDAYELIKNLKKELSIPIHLHTHFTSGLAPMTHLKAVEAGVDIIDTCMSPYAYRSSHPAIEPLVISLLGTNRDTGLDIKHLSRINDILEKDIMPRYKELLDDTRLSIIDINVLIHQTPGGMLSNLIKQLKDSGNLDRLDDFYRELPRVRKELGQAPLVTPSSQIIGTQTINNILFDSEDERYSMISDQVKDLCFGMYGKTPAPIDSKIQEKALLNYHRGSKAIDFRPAEIIEGEFEKAKDAIKEISERTEDIILYALFPVTGKKFLENKYGLKKAEPEKETVKKEERSFSKEAKNYRLSVNGEFFEVWIEENSDNKPVLKEIKRADKPFLIKKEKNPDSDTLSKPDKNLREKTIELRAPMPGMVARYEKKEGEKVREGETIMILEAMKMENAIAASKSGRILSINYAEGDFVEKNSVLALIEE